MYPDEVIQLKKQYYWTREVANFCGLSKAQFNREIYKHRERLNHNGSNMKKRWYLYQVKDILEMFGKEYVVTISARRFM